MGVHPKFGFSGCFSTSSSTNPLNLPIKKREVAEEYYFQEIQDEDRLAMEKDSKKRPCPSTGDHEDEKENRKIPKKMESGTVVQNEETKELERFVTGEMNGLDAKVVIQKKMKRGNVVQNEVTEELERLITCEMNGSDAKLVIQMILYRSDLKEDQNRLNMPIKQRVTLDFLTAEEKKDLEDRKNIMVRLVGPGLQMYEKPMVLRAWSMKRTKNYVLKTNWNSFVKDNKKYLKENSKIQVWSFRKDQQLCFALIVVDILDVVDEVRLRTHHIYN